MALKSQTQVLVVGAGPVGLFTALSLAERGIEVQIIDKEWRGSVHSYALALHPSSLRLLDEYGAADELMEVGHRIERVAFYEGDERVGAVQIGDLGGAFSSVLVVPQSALENALEQRLRQQKVKVLWNHQALAIDQEPDKVVSRVARMEKYSVGYPVARTEWMTTKETAVSSAFIVGADGYHSGVRKAIGASFEHQGEAEAFSVYEFPSKIEFQHEGRVVFSEGTTNVVWPLDERRGRWSFQVPKESPPEPKIGTLREMIHDRASWFRHQIDDVYWSTTALFERRLTDRFGKGGSGSRAIPPT